MTIPSYLIAINERSAVNKLYDTVNEVKDAIEERMRSKRISIKDATGLPIWKVKLTSYHLTIVYMNGKFSFVHVGEDGYESSRQIDERGLPEMDEAHELGLVPKGLLKRYKEACAAYMAQCKDKQNEDKLITLASQMGLENVKKTLGIV